MNVSILTLGCKVNQAESAFIEGNLRNLGFSIVALSENPDYCIINTCSVTAKSDYQSRQLIRRAVKVGAKVIVTGCYAQLNSDEIRKIEGISSIVLNDKKYSIINTLSNTISSNTIYLSSRSRPFVKVQDGCNFACSYCLVPKARGKSRSVKASEIIEQVLSYESNGYHEIVLTGIHLGSYGHDLNPHIKLSDLIKTLLIETKISRIRISSVELNEIDEEIIELLQENRICKHLHIPLQSGDDTILKRMNRMYSSLDYSRVISRFAAKVSDIALGTDIIVGFPGEGTQEFLNTKRLIETLPFTYLHIFPFSPRKNTLAFQMPDHISPAVKKERSRELNTLNINKKNAYISSQLGKILDIIIEGPINDSLSAGTSGNYLKVVVPLCNNPKNSLVPVRLTGVEKDSLKGLPIDLT
jgi:threonylcarbamoyladenosine tRNA methylthiotransferase MtaB